MQKRDRDRDIARHIHKYCLEIQTAHDDFDSSWESFQQRPTYRNAVSLCLLQIGELSKHLSDDFKETHNEMPWRQIRGMRNFVAHQYGSADIEILWTAATEDVMILQRFCEKLLDHDAEHK